MFTSRRFGRGGKEGIPEKSIPVIIKLSLMEC
jgi:hypothetical protein